MILLDIAGYPHRDRIVRPIKKVIEDTISQVRDSIDTVRDSITNAQETVTDSLTKSDVILNGTTTPTDDSSMLLTGIIVVVAVIALCVGVAYKYRRRLAV